VAARFAGEDSESCAAGEPRTYLTSVRTGASHVPDSLFADLGLMPDGNIVRPADNRKDEDKLITSRFRLPNKIEIQGPSNAGGTGETEVWAFTPVQEAYLSHYDATDAKGYWSMFGTIDAPFFEDVSVQMHTSATGGDYSSPLYMMGGWPAQGWHIDAKTPLEVATFDPSHSGRPADVPTASYRDTTTASTYRPRAEQTWADLIDFGYEMNWDSTRRTFESVEANNDVMVVNIANQIAHLSPGHVELDFGFSYDGLPKINLTQAAYNAVDASTGVANSLVQATSQAAFDALTDGTDRLAKMVGDRMDLVFDETIEGLIDASVDQLMVDLGVTFQATGSIDTARMRDAVSDAFDRAGGIVDQLQQLAASGTAATTMVDQITTNLNRVLQALDTCVRLQRYGEVDSGTLADLFDVANDAYDDPNENALEDFAERLVFDLSAEITSDILNQVWASLLEEHGDKITAAEVALSEVYTEIKAIVTQLSNATSDINQELKAILTAASVAGGEIDTAMDAAEEDILDLILDLSTMDVSVSAWTTVAVDLDLRFREAIKARIYNCEFVTDISTTLKQFLFDLEARMASAIDSGFDALNDILRDAISGYLSGIDEEINGLLGDQLDNYVGAGQVAGYARITGDSLEVLRLDGKFQWKVPEPMEFEAYLEIKSHDSLGNSSCRGAGAGDVTEVIIGANRVPVDWISPDLKANVSTKFSFDGSGTPIGIGGQFEMQGELTYETFVITELGAAVAFGQNEAYLAAEVGLRFSSYELSGGIFFGKSCSIDPLKLIDPDVASLLDGASSFTGAYAYGEAWMPIIGSSCVFNVSAGVGAGVFYFAEGPTFGGKMLAGVSGEALCAVSVKGEIEMIGLKQGDAYKFSGTGRISGKAGSCPFCIKFRESVKLTYEDGSWDVDF